MAVSDWVAIDDGFSVVDAPLATGQVQQVVGNMNAALADRHPAACWMGPSQSPQYLMGLEGNPLQMSKQYLVARDDQEVTVSISYQGFTADVDVWACLLQPDSPVGEYSRQTLSPGASPTTAEFVIPVGHLEGVITIGLVAESSDVGSGGAGVVAIGALTVVETALEYVTINFNPALALTPYVLRWDTSGYPEGQVIPDRLALDANLVPATTDYRVSVWPAVADDQTSVLLGGLAGQNPDFVGKTGGWLIPMGYLEVHALEIRTTAAVVPSEPPRIFRQGMDPSSSRMRQTISLADSFFALRGARVESIQSGPDWTIISSRRGGPISPNGGFMDFTYTPQSSYQALGACFVGAYEARDDLEGGLDWRRTIHVEGLLGLVGLVPEDIKIRVRLTLDDPDEAGTAVVVETTSVDDLTVAVLPRRGELAGQMGRLMLWSGNTAIPYSPQDWHCARGLMTYGPQGLYGTRALHLTRFRFSITEDASELSTTADRLLKMEVKAVTPKRGIWIAHMPCWVVHQELQTARQGF